MTTKYFDVKKGITTGNITLDAATGNIIGVNNANLGNIVTANYFGGTLTTASQPNITSVGTLSSLSVSGNITSGNANLGNLALANYFQGDGGLLTNVAASGSLSNGTSNISIPAVNGNINTSVGGIANVFVVTSTGANVTGYLNTSGNITSGNANLGNLASANYFTGTLTTAAQPNITSVGTLSSLSVSGNANVGNIGSDGVVTANGTITGGNLATTGTLSAGGNANVGNLGTAIITATGNITGANLYTVGEISASGTATVGNVSTIGTLSAGGNANVGNLGTSGLITAGGNVTGGNLVTTGVVSASGTVTGGNLATAGTLSAGGNANVGNLGTTGLITASGNVQGGNLVTGGTLSVTLDANVGNLGTTGFVTASGNVTGGNLVTTGVVSASGNVTGGNVITTGLVSASGNVTGGNVITTGLVSASGNVTGGNLVTTGMISASGNADVGNVNAGNVYATGNVGAGNANITATLTAANLIANALNAPGTGDLYLTAGTGNANVIITTSGIGTVSVGNARITQVAEPTADADAATKLYVDTVAQGLNVHPSVLVATANTLANYSGGTTSYNNGPGGNSIGSYISTTGTFTTIDSVSIATIGTRVLVKNEANAAWNGIYVYTNATAVTRAIDFDTDLEAAGGDFTFVTSGTVNADTGWVQTTDNPVLGTSPIVWTQFSGAGSYTAGAGLTLTGTVFSVNTDGVTTDIVSGNVVVKASAQFTTPNIGAATGTSLSVSGNVNANNVVITNILDGNVANFSGNLTAANASLGNLASANYLSGTLTTAAQPNVTSVGTLSSLTVSGNATVGGILTDNYYYANGSPVDFQQAAGSNTYVQYNNNGDFGASANFTFDSGTNTLSVTNISANGAGLSSLTGGNVTGQVGNALVAGTVYTNAQPNITSLGSLTGLTVSNASGTVDFVTTANVSLGAVANLHISGGTTGQYLKTDGSGTLSWGTVATGEISNGTSNVSIPVANGNINLSAAGNANVLVVTGLGANVSGTFEVTGNANVGNLGVTGVYATTLSSTGTATVGNVSTTGEVSASGTITGGNVATAGTLSVGGNANVGNLGTAVITATGTITGGNVATAGTLSVGGNANVGNLGTTAITATGNITAANFLGALANGTSNVAIPTVNGNVNISSGGAANVLVITSTGANITGTANVSGNLSAANANLGNVAEANYFTGTLTTNAQPNVTSVGVLTSLSVSGNANIGNIGTSGVITAVGNVTAGNLITANNVQASYAVLTTGVTSNRSNVAVTTNSVIDQFNPASFRTAKYIISASGDDGYQSIETLLVHDGVNSYITIYGSVCSNNTADLIDISSNVSGITGNVTLYATSLSANAVVNMVASYILT